MIYYISAKSGMTKAGKWYGYAALFGKNRFGDPEILRAWFSSKEDFDRILPDLHTGDPVEVSASLDGRVQDILPVDGAAELVIPPEFFS